MPVGGDGSVCPCAGRVGREADRPRKHAATRPSWPGGWRSFAARLGSSARRSPITSRAISATPRLFSTRESFFFPASSRYMLDNQYDAWAGSGVNWVLKDYLLFHLAGADVSITKKGTTFSGSRAETPPATVSPCSFRHAGGSPRPSFALPRPPARDAVHAGRVSTG